MEVLVTSRASSRFLLHVMKAFRFWIEEIGVEASFSLEDSSGFLSVPFCFEGGFAVHGPMHFCALVRELKVRYHKKDT